MLVKFEKTKNFWEEVDNMFKEINSYLDMNDNYSLKKYYDEKNNQYHINLLIPGFTKDEINISVENNILSVEGKTKNKNIEEIYSSNSVKQSFNIKDIDVNSINAELNDGILKIIYKLKEKDKPNKIKIDIK